VRVRERERERERERVLDGMTSSMRTMKHIACLVAAILISDGMELGLVTSTRLLPEISSIYIQWCEPCTFFTISLFFKIEINSSLKIVQTVSCSILSVSTYFPNTN
jgi:hypothetical protein